MPPQFENNLPQENNPAPIIPSSNNPMLQKPPRGHAFLLVLTFLLILTGFFGVWYFSHPLPDDMEGTLITNKFSGWKTYNNTQIGIEAKYPEAWSMETQNRIDIFNLPADKVENGTSIQPSISVNVSVSMDDSKKYNNLSDLENSLKSELGLPINSNFNDSSISEQKIGNNNFLVYDWMHQGQGVDYYTLANGHSIEIRFVMGDTILPIERSKNYPYFLKFLSTLKFISTSTQVNQ